MTMMKNQPDPRFTPFRERIEAFYRWRWFHECPWDGSESGNLAKLLKACPKLDVNTFSRWLYNYGLSEDIAPGERPRAFLPRIHNYSIAPLDRYGRDQNASQGKTFAQRDSDDTIAAARRIRSRLASAGANGNQNRQAVLRAEDAAVPRRPHLLSGPGD